MIGCATCGADPIGTYNDGSPRYPGTCDHPAIFPGSPLHPGTTTVEAMDVGPPVVFLDDVDLVQARIIGTAMHEKSRARGEQALMKTYDPADAFVLGVQGEMALSRWAGVPYKPVYRLQRGAPDVGSMHLRTRRDPRYSLPIRMKEVEKKPRAPFVLAFATIGQPKVIIRGWIRAGDAARAEWIQNYGGHLKAYFVPPEALRPAVELITTERATAGLAPL